MGRAPSSRVIRARPCAPPGSRSGSSGLGSSATSAVGRRGAGLPDHVGRARGRGRGMRVAARRGSDAASHRPRPAPPGAGVPARRRCAAGPAPVPGGRRPGRLGVVQDIDREVQGQDVDDGLAQPLVVAALGDRPHVPRLGDGHGQGPVGARDRGGGVEGGPRDPARGGQPLEDRRPRVPDPGDRRVVARRVRRRRGRCPGRRSGRTVRRPPAGGAGGPAGGARCRPRQSADGRSGRCRRGALQPDPGRRPAATAGAAAVPAAAPAGAGGAGGAARARRARTPDRLAEPRPRARTRRARHQQARHRRGAPSARARPVPRAGGRARPDRVCRVRPILPRRAADALEAVQAGQDRAEVVARAGQGQPGAEQLELQPGSRGALDLAEAGADQVGGPGQLGQSQGLGLGHHPLALVVGDVDQALGQGLVVGPQDDQVAQPVQDVGDEPARVVARGDHDVHDAEHVGRRPRRTGPRRTRRSGWCRSGPGRRPRRHRSGPRDRPRPAADPGRTGCRGRCPHRPGPRPPARGPPRGRPRTGRPSRGARPGSGPAPAGSRSGTSASGSSG